MAVHKASRRTTSRLTAAPLGLLAESSLGRVCVCLSSFLLSLQNTLRSFYTTTTDATTDAAIAMDYDAYDALLHYIFKQVRSLIPFPSPSPPCLLSPPSPSHPSSSSSPCSHILTRATQTQGDAWFKPSEENIHAGVCIRVANNQFRVFPYENRYLEPFEAAVRVLNPVVAVKVRSAAIHAALSTV